MIDFEKILKDEGITQSELARRLGLPVQTINRMIKGDDIKLSNVIKIAEAIGRTPESLMQTLPGTIIVGHRATGGAKVEGNITLSDCQTELEKAILQIKHLQEQLKSKDELLAEKDILIGEKERMIKYLMDKN